MNDKEFDVLESKGKELSEWLKKNYDPYVAIVITDIEVKLIRTEYSVPTNNQLIGQIRMTLIKDR